jgi:hypothetical protein
MCLLFGSGLAFWRFCAIRIVIVAPSLSAAAAARLVAHETMHCDAMSSRQPPDQRATTSIAATGRRWPSLCKHAMPALRSQPPALAGVVAVLAPQRGRNQIGLKRARPKQQFGCHDYRRA